MAGFLDEVVIRIKKGVDTVSDGSKLIVEKARINTQIQELDRDKNKIITNIGTLIYNLHSNGDIQIEQCVPMCNEITSIIGQIDNLKQQLQALETAKDQYTAKAPLVETSGTGITCACGFVNKEGAKYCSKCGKSLT